MKTPHVCQVVGRDYFDTAPTRSTSRVVVRATPEQIFEAFEDADAWPQWAPPITGVTWTSPRPYQIGTTRTVDLVGNMVAEEEFFAWEPNREMGFYFVRTTMPADAFAELYEVSDLGGGETEVLWHVAMTPAKGRKNPKLVNSLLARSNQWMLGRFKKLVERRVRQGSAERRRAA